MKTVAEITQDIMALPEAEFSQLMKWVWDHDWERWDRQLKEDIKAGRLEFLKEKILEARKQGALANPDTEIAFQVRESPDGGYSASAVGHSIFTQGDDWGELIYMMRDAVLCHFDDDEAPKAIRVHLVQNEVIPV